MRDEMDGAKHAISVVGSNTDFTLDQVLEHLEELESYISDSIEGIRADIRNRDES